MSSAPKISDKPASTIDEVIERLGEIIANARSKRSRLGFFAALYRKVTVKVKEGIAAGKFENGPRMERLDVVFANRYLEALARFLRGERPSQCWRVSFEAARLRRPLILQHLLLGMNAHINFDLGIAAAETAPGDQLPSLKHDFDQINSILASLVGTVEAEIDDLSPWISFLDHIDPSADEAVINFSMDKARMFAWDFAEKLAPLNRDEWAVELETRDAMTAALGGLVAHPVGILFNAGLCVIRMRETNDIVRIIDVLSA